jgi:glycosyltransferase involved in cell wall biosynthesis
VRVTAVVCTHNRGALLAACLRSLARQELAAGAHEILVVDNASTDDTPGVIDDMRARHAWHFRLGGTVLRVHVAADAPAFHVASFPPVM